MARRIRPTELRTAFQEDASEPDLIAWCARSTGATAQKLTFAPSMARTGNKNAVGRL